jgi:4-amino-4-deoxy-L-arabinose transferase-like glycosyltransferase/putative flippase GtrA
MMHAGRVLALGALSGIVALTVIVAAGNLLALDIWPASVLGYLVGMLLNFTLNKSWTLAPEGKTASAFLRCLAAGAVAHLVMMGAMTSFLASGISASVDGMLVIPLYLAALYGGTWLFVFGHLNEGREGGTFTAEQGRGAALSASHVALCCIGVAVTLIVVLYRLSAAPIELWDEARLANNAVEMYHTGLSLITTYNWAPDHWNTKPPLLIWLMAISMKLVGLNELGVRLPSVLATFATAALVYWFMAVRLKRTPQALLAVILMLATPGYIVYHGARSGDYDALLTLLTTTYLLASFLFIESESRHARMYFAIAVLAIVLAFYTKTVQGLIFLPALVLYAAVAKRLRAVLTRRYVYAGCVLVATSAIAYYWIRNQIDPGYFDAVKANDLGGRYATAIEGHKGAYAWYLAQGSSFPWMIPGFALAAYVCVRGAADVRRFTWFLSIAALFYLAVLSSAATKIVWYAMPLVPLSAMLCALGIGECARTASLPAWWKNDRRVVAALGLAAACVAVNAAGAIDTELERKRQDPLEQQSYALRSLIGGGATFNALVVLHPGYRNETSDPYYIAPQKFYADVLNITGSHVIVAPNAEQLHDSATLLVCHAQAPIDADGGANIISDTRSRCALRAFTPLRNAVELTGK